MMKFGLYSMKAPQKLMKMALTADDRLSEDDTSQKAIASIPKEDLIETMEELKQNFEGAGVLLLNTALVFRSKEESKRHIRAWQGFVSQLLEGVALSSSPDLILFGAHARDVCKIPGADSLGMIAMEHPYNHTFITNPSAHELFRPMGLLLKR
jgi:uracil-DNA glycosylase